MSPTRSPAPMPCDFSNPATALVPTSRALYGISRSSSLIATRSPCSATVSSSMWVRLGIGLLLYGRVLPGSRALTLVQLAASVDELLVRRELREVAQELERGFEVALADERMAELELLLTRGLYALLEVASSRCQREDDAATVVLGRAALD